jgi:putative PIN family toxin of toxin-antitoxin system
MATRRSGHERKAALPPRVVLDTNVVLSALVFGRGSTAALRTAWQSGRFVPLVSAATAQELVRVLAYPKFKLSAADREELLADYLPYAQVVVVPNPPPVVPDCRDAFDLPFLQLAVAGKASLLVTGDDDLLSLGRVGRCGIVTPGAFALSVLPSPS